MAPQDAPASQKACNRPEIKTSIGPIEFMAGLEIEIRSGPDGWTTAISKEDSVIATDIAAAPPWTDRRAAGRISTIISKKFPDYKPQRIKDHLVTCFEDIRNSPDISDVMSEAVARVINRTHSVEIELCDPPVYVIRFIDDKSLILTAAEVASSRPVVLNTKWIETYPRESLRANTKDFCQIIDFWQDSAIEVAPAGNVSAWEAIVERLQLTISPYQVSQDKECLLEPNRLYQEPNGPLWIPGRIIGTLIQEAGRSEYDSGFSNYLQQKGLLVHTSKPFRIGQIQIRAWGFDPVIWSNRTNIVDCADLADSEEGQI